LEILTSSACSIRVWPEGSVALIVHPDTCESPRHWAGKGIQG
jgi:hypothetical protein